MSALNRFSPRSLVGFAGLLLTWLALSNPLALADGPTDNIPATVRPIPPVGIELHDDTRRQLLESADKLTAKVETLSYGTGADRAQVRVMPRAVRMAVEDGMFYSEKEVEQAAALIQLGESRLQALASGKRGAELMGAQLSPTPKPQLVVGGYVSRIDGSVQPYGLVLPASTQLGAERPRRLDVWLHGRGEKTSEAAFLTQRLNSVGEITPSEAIVLHPYGRYCNAFKFAGEIDVLEAIEHVKSLFPIDDNRITIRGFSMGGAGCWQMAVHYPGLWMAATPGAGFSETKQFLKVFQKEDFQPTAAQSSLLHWYDCPDWANNLRLLPTIAYSGEIDNQKQAADVMEAAMKARGLSLKHVIGPQTGHKIHPDSKMEIENFLETVSQSPRSRTPAEVDFTTYSLRYPSNAWLTIEGLEEHWQEARVRAVMQPPRGIKIETQNISALSIALPVDQRTLSNVEALQVSIDDKNLDVAPSSSNSPRPAWFSKSGGVWSQVDNLIPSPGELRKRPGLQGPIDDAFLDAFVFIGPQADRLSDSTVDRWTKREFDHAKQQWRKHFRGEINERTVATLSETDIASKNLILFGTPCSNPVITTVLSQLPLGWQDGQLTLGSAQFSSAEHVPVLIYPNPLNPNRYIVLNSGFTFREFAYLNNARQIAMLPDWAIIDASTGSNSQLPGKIAAEGFFDEAWKVKP